MAENLGSNLDKNPFKKGMNSSIPNAAEISQSVMDSLQSASGSNPLIDNLIDYYEPLNIPFQDEAAKQKMNVVAKIASTKQVVVTVKGMKVALTSWIKDIANVYDKGSKKYNLLLIGGTTDFYNGSRAKRLIRVNALIKAIGSDPLLSAVKLKVQLYANALASTTSDQTAGKKNIGLDTTDINALRDACTKGLWYVYAGLLMIFIDTPSKALAFFPMEFIYKAANQKIYKKIISAHIKKKICSHLFKIGETVEMTNNGKIDLKIGLAFTAKSNVLVWYTLPAGVTVEIDPKELGDIKFKYVMAENESLLESGDITFIINTVS